jgi:FAD-dependent oxidoreductase domain-containing protein 1
MRVADVLIIGGGVVGQAVAYHLLTREPGLDVVVLERDPMYRQASSGLSVGGIRQQFGTAVNVLLTRDSVRFYAEAAQHLGVDGEPVDLGYRQNGYLFLATAATLPLFERRVALAASFGVPARLISPAAAAELVPGLAVDDLAGAAYCPTDGYLDPHSVLTAFRRAARALGARWLEDEALRIATADGRTNGVVTARHGHIAAGQVVVAAGAWTRPLLAPTGLDLPIRPLRRQVYLVHPRHPLPDNIPLTIDPTGVHFRPETGGRLIVAGPVPSDGPERPLDWDREAFTDHIWAPLAARVPALADLRLEAGWAGYYDENTADHNAVVGRHPEIPNLFVIAGFSGHGLMQCPAAARGLVELMLDGRYRAIDLSPLAPDRFERGALVLEEAVI